MEELFGGSISSIMSVLVILVNRASQFAQLCFTKSVKNAPNTLALR
jgi:hypothetical protein